MPSQSKPKFDPNSPQIKAFLDDVRHGTFTREGTMVAFPMCLPGMTIPIVPDESHITALDATPVGVVCGATSGRQTHLFAASVHGLSGIVFDLGTPEGATQAAAVCCDAKQMVAFVNGPRGGRAISTKIPPLSSEDLIQEWGFDKAVLKDEGECAPGEPVVDAAFDHARKIIVGATSRHVFTFTPGTPGIKVAGEAPGTGKLGVSERGVYGRDDGGTLWRYDPAAGSLQRRAVPLPKGFGEQPLVWAADRAAGLLYTADAQGRLYSLDRDQRFSGPLAQAALAPVGPMAVTFDGRLFGFCGEEMAKMFCYDPRSREVSMLGVAASVIERRRYGYVFGAAVTGRDGEVVFGEDDDGGHLWLYFPRIRRA